MKPQTQKPDQNVRPIRALLKDLAERGVLDYIEPQNGLGCDFMVFLAKRIVFVEVKNPEYNYNLTTAENRLMEICARWELDYVIVQDEQELIDFINWRNS